MYSSLKSISIAYPSQVIRTAAKRALRFAVLFGVSSCLALEPSIEALLKEKGTTIFTDDFDRVEEDDSKEDPGNAWRTNSKGRSGGAKQVDLSGESLVLTRHEHADHGVHAKHDAPFRDGVVSCRLRIFDEAGVSILFSDPDCKAVVAGHICTVGIKENQVFLRDGKTGMFSQALRKLKLAGADKATQRKFTKGKTKTVRTTIGLEKWHVVDVVIIGDRMTAYVDNELVGELQSPGIGHHNKAHFAFGAPNKAEIDRVTVWRLQANDE